MGKRSRRRVKPQKAERMPFRPRTFEGMPSEVDWVAMREFVPAATAQVRLAKATAPETDVRVCTLLPAAAPGLVRSDGQLWIGLQVNHNFGDPSRDLAHAVEIGLQTEPGNEIVLTDPGVGSLLQDLVDPESSFEVTVHDGFGYWTEGVEDAGEAVDAAIEQANEMVAPTARLEGVEGAYWTEMGERQYVRWVMPHDEEKLLSALARLRVADSDRLGTGTRLIGSFRAHGLLVPVWEVEEAQGASALDGPAAELAARLDDALADSSPLSTEQRQVRNGLASRQITVR